MRLTLRAPPWAAYLASDLTDMDRDPRPVSPGESLVYDLPDDVYFEYGFIDQGGKLRRDPANDDSAPSAWHGEVSVVRGPAYRPGELADPPAALGSDRTERLKLEPVVGDGPPWRVSVYTPAGEDGPLPLVIAQDGVAFYRLGKPQLIAEALRARGEILAARFAFVEPHDRSLEYGYDDAYQRFLAERLEPELEERYPSTAQRVYLGASLGAVASAQAALRRSTDPELAAATTVLSYSGAFRGAPGDDDYYRSQRSWLLERVSDPGIELPRRWYLEIGTLEWLLDVNRAVAAALGEREGVSVELRERSAGHNWPNWRDGLADGLRFALPRR